jgi:hypothetical protein
VPRNRIPSYRQDKPKGLGLVVLDGRYHYLGKYATPESLAEYHRLIQEWLANHRRLPDPPARASALTVGEVRLACRKFAEQLGPVWASLGDPVADELIRVLRASPGAGPAMT